MPTVQLDILDKIHPYNTLSSCFAVSFRDDNGLLRIRRYSFNENTCLKRRRIVEEYVPLEVHLDEDDRNQTDYDWMEEQAWSWYDYRKVRDADSWLDCEDYSRFLRAHVSQVTGDPFTRDSIREIRLNLPQELFDWEDEWMSYVEWQSGKEVQQLKSLRRVRRVQGRNRDFRRILYGKSDCQKFYINKANRRFRHQMKQFCAPGNWEDVDLEYDDHDFPKNANLRRIDY